jgi:hypothetical protein
MTGPVFLAHGLYGVWDELIFVGVGVLFLLAMVYAWIRSRNAVYEDDETPSEPGETESSDHFPLV